MENRAHALIAGLFTLLLGAAVVLALYFFGEPPEETREVIVVTRQNVSGLNPQAQVRYRGIRVGKVLGIQLDPQDVSNILIRIEVVQQVPLTRSTSAKLAHQGVTGIAHVLLEDDGSDRQPLSEKLPRIAMQPSLFDHIEDALPIMLVEAQRFLKNANALLDDNNRRHLGKTLANLEESTGRMNATLAQMQSLLSDANVAGLSSAIQKAGPLMQETHQLMADLQGVSRRVEGLLSESGPEGGVGTLAPRINHMAEELTAASRQLNRVLRQLEDAPQSLVFGAPSVAPGPGESGFSPPSAAAQDKE
ncbi:MAG: MlaD family protein [Zoogloeaceae bacterium]|nr:MlaD family protein [Zoogloeaceae bacterium]